LGALVLAAKSEVQAGVPYYGALTGVGKHLHLMFPLNNIFTKESSPVLILHGTDDTTVNIEQATTLATALTTIGAPCQI
jgi:dipeptidyl aminopeptidase/acylaminoacyl peptidase